MRRALRPILWLGSDRFLMRMVVWGVPTWWGLVLGLDVDTFATSGAYAVMAEIMGEGTWAACSGLVSIFVLLCWARPHILNEIAAYLVLLLWHGAVALCLYNSVAIGTGTGTYALLALAATLRSVKLVYAYSDDNPGY